MSTVTRHVSITEEQRDSRACGECGAASTPAATANSEHTGVAPVVD